MSKSYGVLGTGISAFKVKLTATYFVARRVANILSDWVAESNAYVENLNLFSVAMGEATEEALRFANAAKEALGIDPSVFIRNMGVFKQITSGFGVAANRANLMAKNLTQLGYDISSFFNISVEEAMLKVQSGISGELEPLRRLGYALNQATLQQIAYQRGITKKVNTMTQAEKSELRYIAIMQQSTNVMGDMARTLVTPANAMRILKEQTTQLTRALGNMLIPILMRVVPYVQAFVQVLTEAAQRMADIMGFALPKIDYSGLEGITDGATDAEDALEGAAVAAEEVKNAVMGIDELNILGKLPQVAGISTGSLGIELPEYDFLGESIANKVNEIADKIREPLKEALDIAVKVGVAILAWKVSDAFISTILMIEKFPCIINPLEIDFGASNSRRSFACYWGVDIKCIWRI